jgi:formylglycine-generating enzyme required for sulfatase activity
MTLERPLRADASPREDGRIFIDSTIVTKACGKRFLPGAGKTEWFKDHETAPEMVVVPAGSFMMGSPEEELERFWDEGPQRKVVIAQPFAVGRFAVTFDEWDAFSADRGCSYRPSDEGWGRGRRPVINVSWDDANAYLEWLSRKTRRTYRLLSEEEWEYAARAGTTTPFCWGSSISTEQANYNGNHAYAKGPRGENRKRTVPVNSFEPNAWGLYQVHGNVWEWVHDCWNNVGRRIIRGGSWRNFPRYLRAARRDADATERRDIDLGFRVARTLVAP